jgi:hypothetical protein
MGEEVLKACRACGADCRVETFPGQRIDGAVVLFMCANHHRFGGDCPSDLAYFGAAAWNTRPSTPSEDDVERVARAIWALPQDPPNETYSLKMVMTWDTARRIAAALAVMSGG